jgi:hypothetical protein
MTRTRTLVGSCLIAALAMTGAAHAQERQYCESLKTLTMDLDRLETAQPQSTIGEHRAMIEQIREDAAAIERDAAKTRTQAGRQLVQSSRRLAQAARSMPSDATMEQARSRLGNDLANVRRSARQLAAQSGCPSAMPERQGRMGELPHT